MQMQLEIRGAKQFNDSVDGVKYDFTKLVILIPFPKARKDTQIGSDAQTVQWGEHQNFSKLVGRKFPLMVNAEVELVKKGSDVAIEIIDIELPKQ